MLEHFERMNKQLDKQLEQSEQLREGVKAVHDRREQLVEQISNIIETTRQEIRQINLDTCEKDDTKEIEEEDVEGQHKASDNHQMEVSTGVPEEIPEQPQTEENQATKETDGNSSMETSAVEFSGRQGEPEAPNERCRNEKVAESICSKPRQTNTKKMKLEQRLKKGLSKFGASGKKKKKWRLRKKTIHQKSSKEAFQRWTDHVRKKHSEQMNKQQRMQWDPGGLVYKPRNTSSTVPDHRSQDNTFATRILARGYGLGPTTRLHSRVTSGVNNFRNCKLIRATSDQKVRRDRASNSVVKSSRSSSYM
jgi:hypothetical protein